MYTQVNVAGELSCPKPYKYHLKIAPGKKFKILIVIVLFPPSLYWFSKSHSDGSSPLLFQTR